MSGDVRTEAFPLTAMQDSMLFSALADPGSTVYVGQVTCQIAGPVETEALTSAWETVLDSHAALRLAFTWQGQDRATQMVCPTADLPFAEHDLSDLPPETAEQRCADIAEGDKAKAFDLTQAPLMRVALLRLPDAGVRMIWTVHHIILDGVSVQHVLDDLVAIYHRAPRVQERAAFRESLRYTEARNCAQTDAFWRARLAEVEDPVSLVDPAPDGSGHIWVTEALPSADVAAVTQFCAEHKLTRATLMIGAWALLLSRFGRGSDMVFGLSVSGRTAPLRGIDAAVGPFMNTLPFAMSAGFGDVSVVQFLADVQSAQMDVQAHDHAAQAEIKKATGWRAEDPLYTSLVSINLLDAPTDNRSTANGFTITEVDARTHSSLPIAFLPRLTNSAIDLILDIDQSQFSQRYARTVLAALHRLIRQMVAQPDALTQDLAVADTLPPQQFAEAEADAEVERGLHDLIIATATSHPEAQAVWAHDGALTYAELLAQSTALAGRLQAAGVEPGARVGLMLRRGVSLPVAVLGTLMAGASFVPIDPAYPEDHNAFILSDAAVSHLVIGPDCDAPPDYTGVVLPICGEGGAFIPVDSKPSDLAYVIYTSGSTGRPKGVAVPHQSIVASTLARRATYAERPERFLVLSSFAFDSVLVGLLWPLVEGGTVILPAPRTETDVDQIADILADQQATHTLAIPSLYRLILDHAQPAQLRALKVVIVAGEPCPPDLIDAHSAALPGVRLCNEFGPTETSIWCAAADLSQMSAVRRVPIGTASAASTVTIRDAEMRELPDGILGEICVSGPCLARGYINNPDATVAVFQEGADGQRLYRTGDLGYVGDDGLLYCTGRLDAQVKIRGFRVEPAHISTALQSLPDVTEAIVVAGAASAAPPAGDAAETVDALLDALAALPPETALAWVNEALDLPAAPSHEARS